MKLRIKYLQKPFRFAVFSLTATIFLHASKSSCGSTRYGLPLRFVRSHCNCEEHLLPINFLNLGVDLLYHLLIWVVLFYLWKDAKETWRMLFGTLGKKSSNYQID